MTDSEITRFFQSESPVADAFALAARPNHPLRPWSQLDRLPLGIEGIDLESMVSQGWRQASLSTLLSAILFPWNNYLAATRLFHLEPRDLQFWDAMNTLEEGHFLALASEGLWQRSSLDLGWNAARSLAVARNVIFLEGPQAPTFEERKKQIYRSVAKGRSAICFSMHHTFEGNDWRIQCGPKAYRSGERIPQGQSCSLIVETPPNLPFPHLVRVIRNGEVQLEHTSRQRLESFPFQPGRGFYRIEVWLQARSLLKLFLSDLVPYLFYNPIYLD